MAGWCGTSSSCLALVFGIFAYAIDRGHGIELARTMAVNMLVVLAIFHLFFIRNLYGTSLTWSAIRGTRVIRTLLAVIVAAQFAVTYVPFLQSIFGTRGVPFLESLLIVASGVVFFLVLEVEKQLRIHMRMND